MKTLTKKLLGCAVVIVGVVGLGGCGNPKEAAFVGEWVDVKNECSSMVIAKVEKAEDGYTVTGDNSGRKSRALMATLTEGALVVKGTGYMGMQEQRLAIDGKTGNLVAEPSHSEYVRGGGAAVKAKCAQARADRIHNQRILTPDEVYRGVKE